MPIYSFFTTIRRLWPEEHCDDTTNVCWFCILFFGRVHENICYITYDIFIYTGAQSVIRPLKSRIACKKLVKFQSFIWGHTNWTTLGYAVVQSRVSASQHVEGWVEKVTGTGAMTNTAWNVTPHNFQIFWEGHKNLKKICQLSNFFGLLSISIFIKVSEFQNVFLVSSILPKKRKNSTLLLWYLMSNCFRSFFGRIEDTKKTFRN